MGGWSSTLGGGLGSSMYGSNDSLLRSPAASSGGFQDFGFGGGGGLLDQVSHDFGGGGGGFFD